MSDGINNEWWRSIPNNPPQQSPRPKPSDSYNQLRNTPLSRQMSALGQQLGGLSIQFTSQSQSQTITNQPQQQVNPPPGFGGVSKLENVQQQNISQSLQSSNIPSIH